MAFLFEINEKVAFPNAETLLISPFKEIWERDKSKGKENALEEFAYIEFMTSMKKSNPYRQYPEDKKEAVIIEAVITQEDWEADELIKAAMDKIVQFQKEASTTYNFYMSAKTAAEKMQDFFNTVDINERGGKFETPIWKPKDITSALNDTEKVLSNLKALEKKVEEELFEETKNRSNKEISPFADPNSLK
jgi:hypothetical protein